MKRLFAWALVVCLSAMVSVGATWAYLVNSEEDVNVMTVGKVLIEQLEYEREDTQSQGQDADVRKFHNNKPLLPGVYHDTFDFSAEDSRVHWDPIGKDGYHSGIWDPEEVSNELDKMVFVRNKGNFDAYIRTVFAFETTPDWSFTDFQGKVHLNQNTADWTWSWMETPVTIGEGTYYVAVAVYGQPLPPDAVSEISLSQVMLDKHTTNTDIEKLGDTYQILVYTQAIQTDGYTDPETALNEGFGVINTGKVPFQDDKPLAGASMHDAIRYLNADGETDLSAQVQKVVFGTTKAYSEIALKNDGVPVDVQQGSETHAYYVKDDQDQYTVYILSDDKVYAPADATGLFENMSALTVVDTSNLDVSCVEVMDRMFYSCEKLQSVDVSQWDTSNVTSTNDMF